MDKEQENNRRAVFAWSGTIKELKALTRVLDGVLTLKLPELPITDREYREIKIYLAGFLAGKEGRGEWKKKRVR